MISSGSVNTVPALLFVLTLNSNPVSVAGIVGDSHVDMDGLMTRSDCFSSNFAVSEIERCFRKQSLPAFKLPWDPEFLSSFESFLARLEEDFCKPQFVKRMKEAYHCFYNSCNYCFHEFRANPPTSITDRNALVNFLQNLDLYLTDPDLFGEAVRDICEMEDGDWSCSDDLTWSKLLLCVLDEVRTLLSLLKGLDQNNTPRAYTTFKPAVCGLFQGFQRCATAHLKSCPERTVSVVSGVVVRMTPPACRGHGTTMGTEQDTERQTSHHIHEEH